MNKIAFKLQTIKDQKPSLLRAVLNEYPLEAYWQKKLSEPNADFAWQKNTQKIQREKLYFRNRFVRRKI